MPINISDVVVNIGQNSQSFDYYQFANTIISLFGTLAAAFGGAYYGAKLTDNRKKLEEYQNNIDKTLFLQSFIEKYILQLIDYKTNIIDPKIADLSASNLVKVYKRYPYTSYRIALKMEDYNFFLKENKDLWNVLYQVLHASESFDSTVKIHDSLAHGFNPPVDMVFITRIQDTVQTLAVTCDNLIFFLFFLYKNINILLDKTYKQKFTCADALISLCNFDKEKLDKTEREWVEGLEKSWNKK